VADATTSVLLAAFLKLLIHFGFAFWTVHGLSSTGVYFLFCHGQNGQSLPALLHGTSLQAS
jgi:hypothetical protein